MKRSVRVDFDEKWVSEKRADAALPVIDLINELPNLFPCQVQGNTFTYLLLIVKDQSLADVTIERKIRQFIEKRFSLSSTENILTVTVKELEEMTDDDCFDPEPSGPPSAEDRKKAILEAIKRRNGAGSSPKKEAADPSPAPTAPPAAPRHLGKKPEPSETAEDVAGNAKIPEEEEKKSAALRISSLIGVEEFKKLAEEFVTVAPGLIRHKTREVLTHQCFLFSINDGNGLSTYLNLFADLFNELQLFRVDVRNKVKEVTLPAPESLGKEKDLISFVGGQYPDDKKRGGRVICVDISEWMTHLSDKDFRTFLSELDDQLGSNIIVFRVPFVEKEIVKRLCSALGDVLSIRPISFVPFSMEELSEFARLFMEQMGFSMEEEAWEVFQARITEEKNDGKFYGINTVNKIVREMIYQKQLQNALAKVDNTLLKKQEIIGVASSLTEGEKSGLAMLGEMIGMEAVRTRVEEIVGQIELSLKNKKLSSPCIHMRFEGNPGTGKTTVARIIGKILKEKGILRNGNFFEHAGRDFCGRFVGETAPKTAAICRDAYGSVLFIDEAYSLYRDQGYSTVDYGREAIDTLIAEMENHRNDLVVIMAGYTDEMQHLMKANAGLASRMPYVIEFPNYTRSQLFEIFMQMVDKAFTYREGFSETAKEYFFSLPDEILESKEFSNARFVRNLYERTWGKAVMRSQLNKEDGTVLTKEDFLLASSEKEFKVMMEKQPRSLGFI